MANDQKLNEQSVIKMKFSWNDLMYDLKNQLIVPIIGSDLFYVNDLKTNKKKLLYDNMHCQLCEQMEEDSRDKDYWEFMEKNKQKIPKRIITFLNNERNNLDTDPLIKLAKITGFRQYICMTYDNYFESILKEERCNEGEQIETIDFSINNNSKSPSSENITPVATIYNLMGSIDQVNGFAKTEEEELEHLYSLTERNPFRDKLFNDIKGKDILLIGCKLPNWQLRFLIRIITNQRLNDTTITKIIADSTTLNDRKLCLFLSHFNSSIYPVPNSTSLEFVHEMYTRWEKEESSVGKRKYEGVVFLSYSSLDREAFVKNLNSKLVLHGVNVFYDKEKLDAGDYFNEKIKKTINKCRLFVPLISQNSLNPERYAIKEWKKALNVDEYYYDSGLRGDEGSFIKPFIIDDIMPNDPRISEIFKHISVQRESNIDKIVEIIIGNLKK